MPDTAVPRFPAPEVPCVSVGHQAQPPLRASHDVYRLPHKAVRHSGARLLMRLGSAGWEDALDSAGLVADLQLLLDFIRRHMALEEDVIHPALELRLPGFCQVVDRQHRRQLSRICDLDLLITRMARQGEAERPAIGHEIYLAYASFFGEHLCHMQEEENVILPMLQQLFTDAQLLALEERIFDRIPMDGLLGGIRRTIPAVTPSERARMLRSLREGAPAEVFLAVLDRAARPTLSTAEWTDLLVRLEIDAG